MVTRSDLKKSDVKNMTYDSENRIREVTDANHDFIGKYWYDDQGFRVRKLAKKIVDGEEHRVEVLYPSMYFGIEQQRRISDGYAVPNTRSAVSNIYVNGVRFAAISSGNKTRYYHTDQVDSVSLVTDETGTAVHRFEYLPYGEAWKKERNTKVGEEDHNPKFNSQELDTETNFYYYNARYYDPEFCRFITADPVVDGVHSLSGWNGYMYVQGNPIVYKDPTGNEKNETKKQRKQRSTNRSNRIKNQQNNSYKRKNLLNTNSRSFQFKKTTRMFGGITDLYQNVKETIEIAQHTAITKGSEKQALTNMVISEIGKRVKKGIVINAKESNKIIQAITNTKFPDRRGSSIGPPNSPLNRKTYVTPMYNPDNKGGKWDLSGVLNPDPKKLSSQKHMKGLLKAFTGKTGSLKKYYDDKKPFIGGDKVAPARQDQIKVLQALKFHNNVNKYDELIIGDRK
jgi:RHS repeat-associated protein